MNRFAIVLTALLGGLGVELAVLSQPSSGPVPVEATHPAPMPPSDPAVWARPLLRRPPFSPDRRPAEDGAAPVDAAGGSPRLAGIVVSPAGRRAIFAMPGGRRIVLGEGDKVAGATILHIDPDRVRLDGQARALRPRFAPGTGKAAPTAAPHPVLPDPALLLRQSPPIGSS